MVKDCPLLVATDREHIELQSKRKKKGRGKSLAIKIAEKKENASQFSTVLKGKVQVHAIVENQNTYPKATAGSRLGKVKREETDITSWSLEMITS